MKIAIFNVLYTVIIIILNLLKHIFGQSLFNKKESKEIKKVTFIRVTLDNFMKFINSPGGIRTCDQSINSRSLYR